MADSIVQTSEIVLNINDLDLLIKREWQNEKNDPPICYI